MSKITGKLDPGVIRMVEFFNDNGLPTKMSCQGHNDTNMSMFWVEFDQSVTSDDIIGFQRKHLNKYGAFVSSGRFVKRVLAFANDVRYSWQYMAATMTAADNDLKRWGGEVGVNKDKGVNLGYVCTDPDCAQYCAKISDARYSYIEYRELFKECVVCHAVIDLTDYSLDEITRYCSSYYNSLEQMVQEYGFRGSLQIMAECIFEQLDFDDMEFNARQKNAGAAIKFIHNWMKR